MSSRSLKRHIRDYYSLLFEGAAGLCAVPVERGRSLARKLRYPLDLLSFLPDGYWDRFHPCGNPLVHVHAAPGERILNLGCGAGIDSFCLHAMHAGSMEIVSLDVVYGVLAEAARAGEQPKTGSSKAETGGLRWLCADGEALPFRSETFDWVLMNGVFNLFENKSSLLAEVARILRTTGRLVGTDLCCTAPLPGYFQEEWDAWAWCMSGACTEEHLLELLHSAGFSHASLIREEEDEMFSRVAFSCCR